MNQLSNIVVDFARHRRADDAARGLTAPDRGAGAPVCSLAVGCATPSPVALFAAGLRRGDRAKRSLPRDALLQPEGPQT